MKERVCKCCNTVKPLDQFPWRGNHYLRTCSNCYNEKENLKQRLKYANDLDHKEKKIISQRHSRWKSKYNVDPEVVYKTLEDQNYKCGNQACDNSITLDIHSIRSEQANLDHNHTTGKFRALLCHRCNLVLGHLERSPDIITGLISYSDFYRTT